MSKCNNQVFLMDTILNQVGEVLGILEITYELMSFVVKAKPLHERLK